MSAFLLVAASSRFSNLLAYANRSGAVPRTAQDFRDAVILHLCLVRADRGGRGCPYKVLFFSEFSNYIIIPTSTSRTPRHVADADAFRPQRWLEADDATFEVMVNALETLWGAGRYKCLGRAIAQVELNKVFVEVS